MGSSRVLTPSGTAKASARPPGKAQMATSVSRLARANAEQHDPLALNASLRVSDDVYARMRTAIITGHFQPGTRFVERILTARLGVSRTPIREALTRLQHEGLVVCHPHRGWFVRSPSFEEAEQAYEMRRVAEGAAGAFAAERATERELSALRRLVIECRRELDAGNRESILLRNNEFHELQLHAARNVFLEQHLKTLWAYVNVLRSHSWVQSNRAFKTQQEHEAIVEALCDRDVAAARELNEVHVTNAWNVVAAGFKGSASAAGGFASVSKRCSTRPEQDVD